MEHSDFLIHEISRIIKRPKSAAWHIENLRYEKDWVLAIALDGEVIYHINGRKYTAEKNDVVLFPPNIIKSGLTNPENPWSFVSILFRMETNPAARAYFDRPVLIWKNGGLSLRRQFLDAAKAWTGKNPLYQTRCRILTTEILYQLLLSDMPYQKVPHIQKLEKARNFIQENFRREISVEDLAETADMSVSYFRRLFHEAYGCSPMQYITKLRIENAKDLLLSGEVNVTEAASLSGFEDIYYFSTLFKKKTGVAPTQMLRKT